MTPEALKFLADQAEKARPRVVACDREPPHVYYTVNADGTLQRQYADEPPARRTAADVETLCGWTLDALARRGEDGKDDLPPSIWYTRDGIVSVSAPADDFPATCTLPLSPSPQMKKLAEWEQARSGAMPGASLTQAELVILLRTLFAGCAPDALLPAVRGVRATKGQEVNSQIAQGKVSLAKSVVAEMTGADKIPERVTLAVPVFAQAAVAIQGRVTVEIDPDPQSERFTLVVHPGSIEAAFAAAEDTLARLVAAELGDDSKIPVYHGKP